MIMESNTNTPERGAAPTRAEVMAELDQLGVDITIGWWEVDPEGRDAALARLDVIRRFLRGGA
jgi:hypothetical protein